MNTNLKGGSAKIAPRWWPKVLRWSLPFGGGMYSIATQVKDKWSIFLKSWNGMNVHCRSNLTAILQELRQGNKHKHNMREWEQQLLHFTQTLEFEHFCLMVEKFETLKDILVWLELDNTAWLSELQVFVIQIFVVFLTNVCRAWQNGVKSLVFVNQHLKRQS